MSPQGERPGGDRDARPREVVVNDTMQHDYRYVLTAPEGRDFAEDFLPQLSPQEMLELGVFGGKYMTDCHEEFPDWYEHAKLSPERKDPSLNFFGVDASLSLAEWRRRGWIHDDDPRGWFQWYCRYYRGRRLPGEDAWQIGRWKAIKRHMAQVRHNCMQGDFTCRPRQRQALLHWAYDPRDL